MTSPTFMQIRAQADVVRQKDPNVTAIGLRCSRPWEGETIQSDGRYTYLIHQCDSPLAARLALREAVGENALRILVTRLEDRELGQDVLLRLSKRSLISLDAWQIVKAHFQAQAIDPRLTTHPWMADALLESMPPGGYPAAPGGFLDAEAVWPLLLSLRLGLSPTSLDLISLLLWSLESDAAQRLQQASPAFRAAAREWLADCAGPVAKVIFDYIHDSGRDDAIAVGLAAQVLFHPNAEEQLDKAIGRFEATYLKGETAESSLLNRWSQAAADAVKSPTLPPKARRAQVLRLDEILRQVGALGSAHLSDLSPAGFDQRLVRLAKAIQAAISAPHATPATSLQTTRHSIAAHEEAARETLRLERVDMAIRLLRRLASSPSTPQSLTEAADAQLLDGGYADWARFLLRSPEPVRELASAYAALFDAVTQRREREAEQFTRLLIESTSSGSFGQDIVLVERVLDEIIAPLAERTPLLLVVLDGMSVAVCRELLTDLALRRWMLLSEPGLDHTRPGLATIPSWTEGSRASLLCGRLTRGDSRAEQKGFSAHSTLLSRCKNGHPPLLFHKATLDTDDDGLNPEVRKAIESPLKRIVGVVVNAIDDNLFKGGQLEVRWSRDAVRVLPSLLHEALAAGRAVVLVADHGHVLEAGATQAREGDGDRWRKVDGPPAVGEVTLAGDRVLAEEKQVIAAWSERIRYGSKKNGYHGGVSPQEMIVPIAILWGGNVPPADLTEATSAPPDWWDEPIPVPVVTVAQTKPPKPARRKSLFDEEPQVTASPPATGSPAWITHLLASEIFAAQKRIGGRIVPPDELFVQVLTELDKRGGKMTATALTRALNSPPIRLRGMLAAMQRVLNIDGYPVLARNDVDDTLTLDRDLLLKQFEIN